MPDSAGRANSKPVAVEVRLLTTSPDAFMSSALNLVFASIEEDDEDISYYNKTVENCKKLAYDIMIEKGFNPDMYN